MTIKRNVQDAWARYKIGVIETQLDGLGGGFDPNEDPVIIGSGATAASGTPSAPTGGSPHAVVLGTNASAASTTGYSVAIGYTATATKDNSVVIGRNATASEIDSVAIGNGADAVQNGTVVIGKSASDLPGKSYAVVIGGFANIASTFGSSSEDEVVVIGYSAQVGTSGNYSRGSTAVGGRAICGKDHGVALGFEAAANGSQCIAIGYTSTCYSGASQAITIGASALAQGDNTIAIGDNSGGGNNGHVIEGVALGSNADISDTGTTITGPTAIGALSHANASYATTIGYGATDNGANSITLGRSSETVFIPGNLDGNNFPTVNPGAGSGLVWNNSGVLTVA